MEPNPGHSGPFGVIFKPDSSLAPVAASPVLFSLHTHAQANFPRMKKKKNQAAGSIRDRAPLAGGRRRS